MPGKIKVKILAGRNLPVMDRSGDTTDAYVEIKFGNTTYKTDVCRKSLNPQWNSEWYRFEVDDAELQDEPLQVRLMDHDTYSANDAIGKVYVNLNPLLLPGSPLAVKNIWTLEATMNSSSGSQGGSVMTGWIPVFDTMHGIRGEVNIIVKVELFSDCNKFRQSSCGVQFFYSPNIPHGYHAQVIHGFVEELVVSDDPEYKWIDKIRTPRASNEARQTLFFKLSGEVQRKIGLKALDLGGNAVVGYVQNFDLEGESGIVARGIGTAVTLVKLQDITSILPLESSNIEDLTSFGLQSKNPLDFSESDDSLPLLGNSPGNSPVPRSPINIRPTTVGRKFPKYEKTPKRQRQSTIRVAEYRAACMRSRQFSLQDSSTSGVLPMRKVTGSSLSLVEDLITESSLKNMLALEDMRGEPAGNPFSRGFKNFRYLHQSILPKRLAPIRSKITDSLDEESDADSNYSSTWSLAGSESNRSSIVDLRNSMRRKKFTHKKMSSNDGIAALLIRSVHSGLPLDSVIEDHETPAPSPVNFLTDTTEHNDHQQRANNDDTVASDDKNVETSKVLVDDIFLEKNIVLGKEKIEYAIDKTIPMISSSETDTSTSEDDEPSESSTNYNILDETYSLIDPSSPDERKYTGKFENTARFSKNRELVSSSLSSPSLRIMKKSLERNDAVEDIRDNDKNPCFQSQSERSLESSTDYNILDDNSSLLESNFHDDAKIALDSSKNNETIDISEITKALTSTESVEKYGKSMINTNMKIVKETNFSSIFSKDCHTECIRDYNYLDDTQSLIDPSLPDDENFDTSFRRDIEDSSYHRISEITVPNFSSCVKNNERSLESCRDIDVEPCSLIVRSFDKNVTQPNSRQSIGDSNFPKNLDKLASVLSIDSEKIDKSLDKIEISKGLDSMENLMPSGSCEIFDSSTDYNVLDDSCSFIEPFVGENCNPILRQKIDSTNFPKIVDIEESIVPCSSSQIVVTTEIIENMEKSLTQKNFSFDSQADENLNSSTDHNVLEDTNSLNEACGILDEASFNENFQNTVEITNSPKITGEPTLCSPLKQIDTDSNKFRDVENSREENFVVPFSTTSPIFNGNDENATDNSIQKISLSSVAQSLPVAKLKHLKFLPKQEHFDSGEDVDFVTSTPVETDVTPPDFSPIDKSPEFFESKKWDFQPIPLFPKSKSNDLKTETTDKLTIVEIPTEVSHVTDKIVENREKEICPLGVTFERITIANDFNDDTKFAKDSKVANDSKIAYDPKKNVEDSETTNDSEIANDSKNVESLILKNMPDTEISTRSPSEIAISSETLTPRGSIIKRGQKKVERTDTVIYKGPPRDREKLMARSSNRETIVKTAKKIQTTRSSGPIAIVVAPPPEEHATRLQVPVIQTTNINVQSTFSPDEMKTQHFGSIGSRKFPLDDIAMSEKFNRKYRQHCMLDLIKTIDAKMMIHHGHHERRDSTKSKQRKKRERINASSTPSPDSIHRTRQHRRRSRSRSPERQHAHARGQVSTLSTHSFPMKNSASGLNLAHDPSLFDSSCENISRNECSAIVSLQKDSSPIERENTILTDHNDDRSCNVELTRDVSKMDNFFSPVLSVTLNNDSSIDERTMVLPVACTRANLLVTKDLDSTVFKSHSAGSLDILGERSSRVTKITNNSNKFDDLCVPCSQLTHRQQDEQPSSPIPASSVLPSSLGSKVTATGTSSTTKNGAAIPNMNRRSSDSDLSITPKGNSLAGSDRSMGGHMRPSTAIVRTMNQDTMEMLEYPFITMQQYPPGFVLNIGGLVSARSVKLLERITNLEEPEGRDAWWTEIRMEVRSHARALACNVVLGYKEEISICDDVCVLNASGTAAVINLLNASQDQDNVLLSRTIMTTSLESERDKAQIKSSFVKPEKCDETVLTGQQTHGSGRLKRTSESNDHETPYLPTLSACSLCHLPYSEASVPFRVDVSKCSICRRAKVPDVLFTTIELPENIPMTGRGVFLQATVCKCKRDLRGELNAKEISDCLPFLEYELHSLLLNKLKVKGMNAIFGLKVQVSVGERLVIGMAVGTAVYLTALPAPSVPQIASGNSWHNEEQLAEIQKTLIETVKKNREFYRLKPLVDIENGRSITTSDTDESDDDLPDLDLGIGTKDACVLEVDDVEDMDRINLLIDERPPEDFHVVNTQSIPGLEDLEIVRNLQMFTQISRAKIPAGQFASMPSKYFARMVQTVLFKLRRMVPCALCDMQFKVALPEQDEIQLSVVGMALGLGEPTRFSKYKRKLIPNSTSKDPVKKTDETDFIFSLDEDQVDVSTISQETMTNQSNTNTSNSSPLTGLLAQKHRPRSPFRTRLHMQHRHKHVPLKERYGVDITPLSYLPGGKIERYLGNLNFFFIRESTSIRENGGLSGFTHSFVTEILAIVRAHITALGGNAMVAFFMTQCVLLHSPHKNQGQCLINVGGDVVIVSYYGDEKYQANQNC